MTELQRFLETENKRYEKDPYFSISNTVLCRLSANESAYVQAVRALAGVPALSISDQVGVFAKSNNLMVQWSYERDRVIFIRPFTSAANDPQPQGDSKSSRQR